MDFSKIGDMEGHYDGEEDMHFYYNRKERIANAPKIVQDYYSGKFHPTGGLLKSLVSTRGNKILLVCVIVCAAAVAALHRFGDTPYRKHIGGTLMTLSAFAYGDDVYVTLSAECTDSNSAPKEIKSTLVEAKFSAYDSSGEIAAEGEASGVLQDNKALLKWKSRDYDIKKVQATVSNDGQTKILTADIGGKK